MMIGLLMGTVGLIDAQTTNGQPLDGYWTVTSYACPPHCGTTASGAQVGYGSVAAPLWVPFGTPVLVDGWYVGSVQDRGSGITGRTLDIWLPSKAQAFEWGRRTVWVSFGWPAVETDEPAQAGPSEPGSAGTTEAGIR